MFDIDSIDAWARTELEAKHAAREKALAESRDLVRSCANCIRAVHRGDFHRARELLLSARHLSETLTRDLEQHPDIYFSGYVQDAQKEYVEATMVYHLVQGEDVPAPQELGVAAAPFLNGLGEAVGELRRYILDQLRQGRVDRCEEVLQTMDDIYSLLVTMDYPEALTGGLRRTTDNVRSIMEKTRGDLTFALRQEQLQRSLDRVGNTGHGSEAGDRASEASEELISAVRPATAEP